LLTIEVWDLLLSSSNPRDGIVIDVTMNEEPLETSWVSVNSLLKELSGLNDIKIADDDVALPIVGIFTPYLDSGLFQVQLNGSWSSLFETLKTSVLANNWDYYVSEGNDVLYTHHDNEQISIEIWDLQLSSSNPRDGIVIDVTIPVVSESWTTVVFEDYFGDYIDTSLIPEVVGGSSYTYMATYSPYASPAILVTITGMSAEAIQEAFLAAGYTDNGWDELSIFDDSGTEICFYFADPDATVDPNAPSISFWLYLY
ncbi:MAG: hypothetical protein LBR37_04210, partial [Erysipelotrichaceae bacterium]|nr:hypothetical protein [Erysipelotrichaceae bacterium]